MKKLHRDCHYLCLSADVAVLYVRQMTSAYGVSLQIARLAETLSSSMHSANISASYSCGHSKTLPAAAAAVAWLYLLFEENGCRHASLLFRTSLLMWQHRRKASAESARGGMRKAGASAAIVAEKYGLASASMQKESGGAASKWRIVLRQIIGESGYKP